MEELYRIASECQASGSICHTHSNDYMGAYKKLIADVFQLVAASATSSLMVVTVRVIHLNSRSLE